VIFALSLLEILEIDSSYVKVNPEHNNYHHHHHHHPYDQRPLTWVMNGVHTRLALSSTITFTQRTPVGDSGPKHHMPWLHRPLAQSSQESY
jgi:hypothetical protein